MKKTNKMITVLLTLCMVIGLFAVTASAEQPKLLILGDSIAAAFGTEEYIKKAGGDTSKTIDTAMVIKDSYADRVANAIGATAVSHAHSGWRSTEFVNVVSGMDYDDFDDISKTLFSGLGSLMTDNADDIVDSERASLPVDIADTDYISINFGANDIYTYTLAVVAMQYAGDLAAISDISFDNIKSLNELSAVVSLLIGTAKTAVATVAALLKELDNGLANLKDAYPKMLDYITELNPDAKIFVNSVACPIRLAINLNEDVSLKIRMKADRVADEASAFVKDLCGKYENVYFVDTMDAENYKIEDIAEEDLAVLSSDLNLDEDFTPLIPLLRVTHPNEAGHIYIANQLLDAINRAETKPEVTVGYNALGQVQVKWNKVEGAKSYFVYRASEINGEYKLIGVTPATNQIDTLAPMGTTSYYKVAASMDALGNRLTEKSEAVPFSTEARPSIGRMISELIQTVINTILNAIRAPLKVFESITGIIQL